MNPMLELLVLVLIVVIGIGVVFNFGSPLLRTAKTGSFLEETEVIMKQLDHIIKGVSREGKNSARILSFHSNLNNFEIFPGENTVSFHKQVSSDIFQYGTKSKQGNLISYAGGGVDCYYNDNNIIMENNLVLIRMKNINGNYNNSEIIKYVKNKISGYVLDNVNLPVIINNINATKKGNGQSIILNDGKNLPKCTVKYTMNSTVDYDMFFSLSTGMDFLSLKVRNLH